MGRAYETTAPKAGPRYDNPTIEAENLYGGALRTNEAVAFNTLNHTKLDPYAKPE